jgi:hypothetical protein
VSTPQGVDADKNNRCTLIFLSPPQVYDPTAPGQLDPTPVSILDWLRSHPYLHVVKESPVTVGGITGVEVDVMTDTTKAYPDNCFGQLCKYLFPASGAPPYGISGGSQFPLIMLKVGGTQVVVSPEAPPQMSPHCNFGIFGPQPDQLLQTGQFVPAGS